MMEGHDDTEMLRLSGDHDLVSLASEYGLLGHTWVDMDALGGCKKTAAFLKSSGKSPDYIIRRSSGCHICHNTSDGGCAKLCKTSKIIANTPKYSQKTLESALRRKEALDEIDSSLVDRALGRVASSSDFKALTAQANLFKKPEFIRVASGAVQGYFGAYVKPQYDLDPEEVRMFISHQMNMGLKGSALKRAILSKYAIEDLKSCSSVGKRLASEENIQGSYYLDPTAYRDYGVGCSEGSSIFKNRGPRNVLASSGCTGCTMQTAPGWCSRYCKSLIRSVPKSVRSASQKRHLPVISSPVENPVEKYEMAGSLEVDMNGLKSRAIDISVDPFTVDE
jgi:hypothetical protein